MGVKPTILDCCRDELECVKVDLLPESVIKVTYCSAFLTPGILWTFEYKNKN